MYHVFIKSCSIEKGKWGKQGKLITQPCEANKHLKMAMAGNWGEAQERTGQQVN